MEQELAANHTRFADEAGSVLGRVQDALRDLVAEVGPIHSPTDLQQTLGTDYRLCWRVMRVVDAADALAAGPHVPSARSLRRLTQAAQRRGAAEETAERVLKAADDFRGLVDRHAGERGFFDTMVGAVGKEGTAQIDADAKRAAFRANCQIHGRLTETILSSSILAPTPAPAPGSKTGRADILSLGIRIGYRQLRPAAALRVAGYHFDDEAEPGPARPDTQLPDDLATPIGKGLGIIERFSTVGMPQLETVASDDAYSDVYLSTDDVGSTAKIDIVLARFERGVRIHGAEERGPFEYNQQTAVRAPTKLLIEDAFVHPSLYDEDRVEAVVFEGDRRPVDRRKRTYTLAQLPVPETASRLGRGLRAAHCTEAPRYGELLRFVSGRLGWDLDGFNLYRCRVEYPVLNSTLRLAFG